MNHRLNPRLALSCSFAALLVLMAGAMFGARAARAESPVMRLDPPSQTVDVGSGPFTVNVLIDNVSNLGAYEFNLVFNPRVLRFVAAEDAGFLGSTQRQVRCPTATLVVPTGGGPADTLHFGCNTFNRDPAGPNGSGQLATVTFAPVAGGHSELTLVASTGQTGTSDIMGEDLHPTSESGSVTVTGEGPAATPRPDEPTAIPTQQYVAVIHVTPTPGGDAIFTPQPGEMAMTRPMPGRGIDGPSADAVTSASDPARASGGSQGSPRAGTGPEQQKSSWPALAGGLLVAAGSGLLFVSFYLKRASMRRNHNPRM
jgi:Cohesin domain